MATDSPTGNSGNDEAAFERIKRENQKLQEQLAESQKLIEDANRALGDVTLRDNLRGHYKAQGFGDPDWAADIMLPHVRGVESDKLADRLAEPQFARLVELGKSSTPEAQPPVEPVDSGTLPGYARPSPGSAGEQVSDPVLTIRSPEVKEMMRRNDQAGLQALVESGRLQSLSGERFNS